MLSCTCANVQGVTWDPASEFVISQSADRTCRYAATALLSWTWHSDATRHSDGDFTKLLSDLIVNHPTTLFAG